MLEMAAREKRTVRKEKEEGNQARFQDFHPYTVEGHVVWDEILVGSSLSFRETISSRGTVFRKNLLLRCYKNTI